jgi:hypothetical protein
MEYQQDLEVEEPQPPRVAIAEVVVSDSAGRRWKIQPGRGGAVRRGGFAAGRSTGIPRESAAVVRLGL